MTNAHSRSAMSRLECSEEDFSRRMQAWKASWRDVNFSEIDVEVMESTAIYEEVW